mgnify:CR=1 FL=1
MTEDKNVHIKFEPLDVSRIIQDAQLRRQEHGEVVPLIEKERETKSGRYISAAGSNAEAVRVGNDDLYVDPENGILAYSGPSNEASRLNEPGQDAVSVAILTKSEGSKCFLLAQADGVGSAFTSDLAAGVATRFLAENGSTDLKENLSKTVVYMQGWGTDLPRVQTGHQFINEAFDQNRLQAGSRTTLNQLLITENAGEVKGLFHGDGEVVVIRADGAVERSRCGTTTTPSQISTKDGVLGQSQEFSSKLNSGDTILLFSDGLDKLGNDVLIQLSREVLSTTPSVSQPKEIVQMIRSQSLRDDDISIVAYRRN